MIAYGLQISSLRPHLRRRNEYGNRHYRTHDNGRNGGGGLSTRDPGREKRIAGQSARRRGEVSLQMTASDILSLAVNVTQNDWPLDGCDSTAMRVMLDEIYGRIPSRRHSSLTFTSPRNPSRTTRTFSSGLNLRRVTLLTRRTNCLVSSLLASASSR